MNYLHFKILRKKFYFSGNVKVKFEEIETDMKNKLETLKLVPQGKNNKGKFKKFKMDIVQFSHTPMNLAMKPPTLTGTVLVSKQ